MTDLLEGYRDSSRLIDSGKVDEALIRINRLISDNQGDATLWLLKGIALRRKGDNEAALDAFESATAADLDAPWPYYRKAELLREMGRPDEALGEIDEALEINPERFDFWQEKGFILEDMMRPDDAFECFGKSVVFNDSAAWSWFGLSRTLVYLDSLPDALQACDKAISLEPGEGSFRQFRQYLQDKLGG